MSTLWKRALATTTIALVAGFGITGCGTEESGNTSSKADKGSQTQPEKAPEASGQLTADDFAERMNNAQYKAGSAHFTQSMQISGQQIEYSGDILIDKDPSKIKMSMSMPGGMEMRLVDGDAYLNMGELTGGKFYKASPEDSNSLTDQLSAATDQAMPGKQLEALKASLKDFKVAPDAETIDGVPTTKYTLTLDTKKMFASLQTEIPASAGIGDTLSYDIYVDSDDLMRRMVMDVAGTTMQADYSKWGEPVTIEAPTADQITDKALGM